MKKYIQNQDDVLKVVLGVLVVIAVVLGVLIIQIKGMPQFLQISADKKDVSPYAQESNVLNFPPPEASQETKQKHLEFALRIAQEGDLDISGCVATPIVLKVLLGEPVMVRNQNSKEHVAVLDADHVYSIGPNETKGVLFDFVHGPGLYGYGCDIVGRAVGIFIVSDPNAK